MNILILGSSGMAGRAMFKSLIQRTDWKVSGSVRTKVFIGAAPGPVFAGVDLSSPDHLVTLFRKAKPDVVVNCAGLTKHVPDGNDINRALSMNTLLPQRLAGLCAIAGARLVHISTDCVFSGKVGNYREEDVTDATDVYGKTKALGEVQGENVVTLRTSIIGHEYETRVSLLEWFLAQKECNGYRRAIFSGLPTVELARIVRDIVIPNVSLSGLYHVGAAPIDKFTLLKLVAKVYKRDTKIVADDVICIDRSLNVEQFWMNTGYRAASWPKLIEVMYQDYLLGS